MAPRKYRAPMKVAAKLWQEVDVAGLPRKIGLAGVPIAKPRNTLAKPFLRGRAWMHQDE